MVDWLSNLQFWKKHYHLVAKFPSYSHFFIFFCYNIVLAPFKLALKVSKLTISFVSSLELVRQVQTFLPKVKSPQEQQQSIKIQKRPFAKQECKHTVPCRNDFEALFPKKCQICKPIANWYIKGVQYTGSPFQYQNGYWDLLLWYCICPTQPLFTNTETAMLSSVQMISSLVSLRMRRLSQAANIWECCWKDQSRLVTSPISLFLCSLLYNEI